MVAEGKSQGIPSSLEDQEAELRERGYFQMLRVLSSERGRLSVEGVACRFWAANGNPLARMSVGQFVYLIDIGDLEEVLSDPAPEIGPTITLDGWPTREVCHGIQGALLVARFVLEVRDEDLLEPLLAMVVEAGQSLCQLQLDGERFLFDPDDFWEAMTDPVTFRDEDTGPSPIDVLRGPVIPWGPRAGS